MVDSLKRRLLSYEIKDSNIHLELLKPHFNSVEINLRNSLTNNWYINILQNQLNSIEKKY